MKNKLIDIIKEENFNYYKENLKEELGDVLLQVVFHSQIEQENGNFELSDVINGISQKMIYRHPHIFGEQKANTADEVLQNWEELKKKEKNYKRSRVTSFIIYLSLFITVCTNITCR